MPRQPRSNSKRSSVEVTSSLPLSVQAYRFLRDAIESSQLAPGTRLLEVELAEQLKMSRTPVREALSRLEADGLIIDEPGYGLMVTELDHSTISELYVVREVLEGTAARLVARHASDVEIALLRQIADEDKKYEGDPIKLAKNNRFFHETLYQSAHNRHLLRILKSLHGALTLLGRTTLAVPGRADISSKEHQELVEALEQRDSDKAEQIIRHHIQGAYKTRLVTFMSQHRGTED